MKLLTVHSSPASIYFFLSLHLERHQCYLFPSITRYQVPHTHTHTQPQKKYSFVYFYVYIFIWQMRRNKILNLMVAYIPWIWSDLNSIVNGILCVLLLLPNIRHIAKGYINPLAPEFFFFLILAHSVYKMWITQEPKKVALWNKWHFEEEKNGECAACLKYSVCVFVE